MTDRILKYKGYAAAVVHDRNHGGFHGRVTNAPGVINFKGSSTEELEKEFANSVELYIRECDADGDDARPFLDYIHAFEYRGHQLEGRARSGNVSASGFARVSNAAWYLLIDGDEIAAVCEASANDTEDDIKPLLQAAAAAFLERPTDS